MVVTQCKAKPFRNCRFQDVIEMEQELNTGLEILLDNRSNQGPFPTLEITYAWQFRTGVLG